MSNPNTDALSGLRALLYPRAKAIEDVVRCAEVVRASLAMYAATDRDIYSPEYKTTLLAAEAEWGKAVRELISHRNGETE